MSQPVHSDADFAHPSHPFAYVINVPLITMTPENGSTEVWLGTHTGTGLHLQEGLHGERASGRIKLDELEKRRVDRPPCQPVVPKGSLVIRDLRLWHAGVGNQTEIPRVMLAMSKSFLLIPFEQPNLILTVHFASWYRNPMKLELADDLRPVIESQTDVEVPVDWVTKPEAISRYLNRGFGNAYNFNQQP
jgi:ectoine hydroxylase-related dioxygenase (phytanoyl-CoA dioxygenase family)